MARPRLSSARKTAAKNVAQKIAGGSKAKGTATTVVEKPVALALPTGNVGTAVVLPGLPSHITPEAIAGMLPKFNESEYAITDPLNPPETLPQATEAQFDKGMTIYEGTQRALKLTGAAFDTTKERFTALGKQAQAFGSGIRAATQFEKVRGDFLDYKAQLETNEQKGIVLDVSQHKTTSDRAKAIHDKSSLDEKLKQSEVAAELARAQTRDKQNKLDEFRKSLGEYAA